MIKLYNKEEIIEIINKDLINENKNNKENIIHNKNQLGEVITPFKFVEEILNILPNKDFENINKKWLDPGAGKGHFSIILYYKLFENLKLHKNILSNLKKDEEIIEFKKNYIIKNMIYLNEINDENKEYLKKIFGSNLNLLEGDYLNLNLTNKFDFIIGNPPFNNYGIKKVPTNDIKDKKKDGKTIWPFFVEKNITNLKENGKMCIFIPSIWLKPDKRNIYYLLLNYQITNLKCFNNTETNKIFKGQAQTPCCYFLLSKIPNKGYIEIFDKKINKCINYNLLPNFPIPLSNIEIIDSINKKKYKGIEVIKTNLPSEKISILNNKDDNHKYSNIKTRLTKNKELIINYSDKPLIGWGIPKIILANKMYGIPYLDLNGEYGISNRDNYIIYKDTLTELNKLYQFLSLNFVQQYFEATRYRMMFLEKYAFILLPDITLIKDFPMEINDETVEKFFQSQLEEF